MLKSHPCAAILARTAHVQYFAANSRVVAESSRKLRSTRTRLATSSDGCPSFPSCPRTWSEDEPAALAGTALRFSDRQHVEIADSRQIIDLSQPFTVELWCRLYPAHDFYLLADSGGRPCRSSETVFVFAPSRVGKI